MHIPLLFLSPVTLSADLLLSFLFATVRENAANCFTFVKPRLATRRVYFLPLEYLRTQYLPPFTRLLPPLFSSLLKMHAIS